MPHSTSMSTVLQGSIFATVTHKGAPPRHSFEYPDAFLTPVETADKSGVFLYSLATHASDAEGRTNITVESLSGLVLDFDGVTDEAAAEELVSRWTDYDCVIHTSHSHMRVTGIKHPTAQPCLRIILPFSRTATVAEFDATWAWAQQRSLPHVLDAKCGDEAHCYYLPSFFPGSEHFELHSGSTVQLDPAAAPPVPARVRTAHGDLDAWLHVVTDDLGRAQLARAVAAAELEDAATGQDRHTHTYMTTWPITLGGYIAGGHLAVEDALTALAPYAERWTGESVKSLATGLSKGIGKGALPAPTVDLASTLRLNRARAAVKAAVKDSPEAQLDAAAELRQAEAAVAAAEQAKRDAHRARLDAAAGVVLQRDGNLRAESSFENVTRILGVFTVDPADPANRSLWWDDFKSEPVMDDAPLTEQGELQVEKILGSDTFRMKFSSPEVIRRALKHVALQTKRHPIKEYFASIKPPTVPVLNDLALRGWCGSFRDEAEAAYAARCARKWMISAVARIFDPGCQADSMIVLQGDQGVRKSTAIKELVGGDRWFNAQELDMDDMKRVVIHLPAYWVHEMAEMRDAKDIKAQKAFITLRSDTGIGMYGRSNQDRPRHSVFFGTVNPPIFLVDPTGNRRFWVLHSNSVDLDWIRANRDSLWAEAHAAYEAGETWWMSDAEEEEVAKRNLEYTSELPVEQAVNEVVSGSPSKEWRVLALLSLVAAKLGQNARPTVTAVGLALKAGGWVKRPKANGNVWCWEGTGSLPPLERVPGKTVNPHAAPITQVPPVNAK